MELNFRLCCALCGTALKATTDADRYIKVQPCRSCIAECLSPAQHVMKALKALDVAETRIAEINRIK